MSQRVAGERARWLAAVLMVASIGAGSVIVRIWPADTASPVLASRHIQLYEAPMAPVPGIAAAARTSGQARDIPRDSHRSAVVAALPRPESVVTVAEPLIAQEVTPQPVAAAEAVAVVADVDVPIEPADVRAAIDSPIENARVVADIAPAAAPAPVSSRGIAEIPAVAVTRAVTVAGRGIMTGLKATTAILRAPF